MPNSDGNTTLSVPKEFADMLRKDFDGRNDIERLRQWSERNTEEKESYNNSINTESIRSDIQELKEKIDENKTKGYNNSISSDDVAEKIVKKLDISSEIEKALPSGAFR